MNRAGSSYSADLANDSAFTATKSQFEMIRSAQISDAASISGIYNEYVRNSQATFDETDITADEMAKRIESTLKEFPWLVSVEAGVVIGYTYARKWRDRAAYRYTAETGTYLDARFTGKGIGTELKRALLDELKARGFHSVISGISLPNPASVALCEKFGFTKVAHFSEVGRKFGRWIDVGYWELKL